MEILKFAENNNNKLNCDIFTTLRPYQPLKYFNGAEFRIFLADNFLFTAKIIYCSVTKLNILNENFFLLDFGLEKNCAIEYLKKLFINKRIDFDGYWNLIFLQKNSSKDTQNKNHFINGKKYLEICPNCLNPWDHKQIESQSCNACGYPDSNDNY